MTDTPALEPIAPIPSTDPLLTHLNTDKKWPFKYSVGGIEYEPFPLRIPANIEGAYRLAKKKRIELDQELKRLADQISEAEHKASLHSKEALL